MGKWILVAVALCLTAAAPTAWAAPAPEPTAGQKAALQKYEMLLKSLHPVFGEVQVAGAKASLKLGKDYYFLPAEEAKRVLTEGWGNPPESVGDVLGMVFPAGKTFMDDSWGAVITYEATGYVSDEDAKSADYNKLLEDMRSNEETMNEERQKAGYPTQHLVGWAQPPSYDPVAHSVVWARDIRFSDMPADTLNYDVRLLGRHGVLSLNMVSNMEKLEEVKQAAAAFGRSASFDSGARYADFNADTDATAGYGIAGLVAAGAGMAAAKKAGILGAILLFGKKFIVVILALVAGVAGWFRRRFGSAEAD